MKKLLVFSLFIIVSVNIFSQSKRIYINVGYGSTGEHKLSYVADNNVYDSNFLYNEEESTLSLQGRKSSHFLLGTSIKINMNEKMAINIFYLNIDFNYYPFGESTGLYLSAGVPLMSLFQNSFIVYPPLGFGYTINVFKIMQLNIFTNCNIITQSFNGENVSITNQVGFSLGIGFGGM